ncbi:MAG: thioredoxin-disulfide reductase [Candidatus Omnitrophota bacterium]
MENRVNETLYDVIIIGGGPAGLTASIYTSRAGIDTLLLESASLPSQAALTETIENYPGFPNGIEGYKLIEDFKKQSKIFGTEFVPEEAESIQENKEGPEEGYNVITKEGTVYKALSVIIATGAVPKQLGVKGEKEFYGRGVSYCATCDAHFYKNKHIMVVGGGDAAVEEALFLTKFGSKVTVIHRRQRLRAAKILRERVSANKKIEIIWNSQVVELLGDKKIRAAKIKNVKTQEETEIQCDGVFVFIGYKPNTDFLKGFINLNEKGHIVTGENMQIEKVGIFACGDCRSKMMFQVITACGDGATAAFSCQKYVEKLKGMVYD